MISHGLSAYQAGCRCGVCKAANRDHQRRARSRLLFRLQSDPTDSGHGKMSGYGAGCRCEACKAAQREYMRGWAARTLAQLAEQDAADLL